MTRNLALALLDDPHGINGVAYGYLTKAMDESEVEWIDIELKVKYCTECGGAKGYHPGGKVLPPRTAWNFRLTFASYMVE
jgi:hypothetical protein